MKAFAARKQLEDASQGSVKIEDPKAVKLLNLNASLTEEDITEAMSKFGHVIRCRIPFDQNRKRFLGFAIVAFDTEAAASKAIAEGEVNVEMAGLTIERALMAKRSDRGDFGDARQAFSVLNRRQ
jgi:RNA recognition motif-containing protein